MNKIQYNIYLFFDICIPFRYLNYQLIKKNSKEYLCSIQGIYIFNKKNKFKFDLLSMRNLFLIIVINIFLF